MYGDAMATGAQPSNKEIMDQLEQLKEAEKEIFENQYHEESMVSPSPTSIKA